MIPYTVEDALQADRHLRALDEMVRLLARGAPSDEPWCYACIWEQVLKPLALPLVGHGRGSPAEPAGSFHRYSISELLDTLATLDSEPGPTGIELWLRGSQAYDLFLDRWVKVLREADPALGHGYPGFLAA